MSLKEELGEVEFEIQKHQAYLQAATARKQEILKKIVEEDNKATNPEEVEEAKD